MRPVLLLLALLGGSTLAAPNWGKVFTSFFPEPEGPHVNAINYYKDEVEPLHHRIKRAVYAALAMMPDCAPGWTGTYCENPLCTNITTVPVEQNTDKLVEFIYAPANCMGTFYVPVDSTCTYLFIQTNTDGAVPIMNLTDSSGNHVPPTAVAPSPGHNMNFYQPIAPGKYSLKIDLQGQTSNLCAIEITVASKLDITHGFVDTPQSDFPPHGTSPTEGQMQNLVVHTYHPEIRAVPTTASLALRGGTDPIIRSPLTTRYGCAYDQYIAGKFTCQAGQFYQVVVDGIDSFGNPFRRTKTGWSCVAGPITPPPTTQPPPQDCMNGGTLVYGGTPNAQCLCRELFTGASCQKPQCMNGGFLNPTESSCICPTGFIGINCQNVACAPNLEDFLTDYSTLVVVWRAVSSMNQYVNAYAQVFYNEMQFLSTTPGLEPYRSFLLVTYANGVYTRNLYGQQQWQNFYDAFTALNSTTVSGNCNDTAVGALQEVFRATTYNKSPIYHFTDAPASDYNDFLGVAEVNAYKKLPIFSLFHNTSSAQTCKVDEISEGYRIMGTLAYMTGGLVMGLSQSGYSQTTALLVRSTSYKINQVLIDDLTVCTLDGYRTFFADSATKYIHIVATGENLLIAITDPNGTVSSPQVFQDGRNYFYTIPQEKIIRGEYLMRFNSYNSQYPCSYRVFARSDYDLFLGVTNAVYTDAISAEPIYGMPNAIVAQINGIYGRVIDPFRLFAEVMIVSNDNGGYHRPLYFSNGLYRTMCGYHLYFGTTNFCEHPGQVFYATVYADDTEGYTIQRTSVGYCAGRAPTQAPPTGCINGGVPDPNNSTQCLCPPLYAGQYCQDYNCQNGGVYTHGICQCPVGLGGTFCEEQKCLVINEYPMFTPNGRSLTFVVSTLPSMNATWQQLATGVQEFVRDIQLHNPMWFERYNLIVMNNQGAQLVSQTQRVDGFVRSVQDVAANLANYQNASNPDCSVYMETGMMMAASNSYARSPVFVFSDSNGVKESSILPVQIMAAVEQVQVQLNFIATISGNTGLCNGVDGWLSDEIQNLFIFSAGWLYSTTDIRGMYHFILTEYNNGIILDTYVDDCTQPQTYYLPVDSGTQSMTVVSNGANVTATVFLPDGTNARNNALELVMVKETYMEIDQFIIPCPVGWEFFGRGCYSFILTMLPFRDASNRCHALGGWSVDIFNPEQQAYVHQETTGVQNWIGLTKVGSAWYWDTADQNQPVQLLNTSYANWKNGVTPNNAANNCAIMDGDGFWVDVPCTETHYIICQKFRFGQDVIPNDPTTNLLPGGFWKLQVQSSSGSCAVQARVQSTIQVYFGFVQDTHMDYPELYANSNATNNYFVAGTTGLNMFVDDRHPSNEGRLNYVYMGFNYSAYNAMTFEDRAQCSYRYLSQNFTCQNMGNYFDKFFARFSGIDQYGYTFERLASSYCGIYQSFCYNGGYVYQGQCVCPQYWTGSRCSIPVCQNGGVVQGNNQCACPSAFTGDFCELAFCEPPYPHPSHAETNRTLAIALETSTLMSTSIFLLKRNLTTIINQITNGTGVPEWWNSYILYPFDSTSNKAYWYPPVYSNNFADLITGLNNIGRGCPNASCDTTTCQRPYLRIISDMIANPIFQAPNSDIVVVTRSSPEDHEIQYEVIDQIQNSRSKVFFLLAGTSSPCNEGWNTPAVDAMRTIAGYTGGGIYPLSPTELVFNWLGVYFPYSYHSGWVMGGAVSENCSFSEYIIPVENAATHLLLDYFGSTNAITVIAPDNTSLSLPTNLVTSSSNYLAVLPLNLNGAVMAGSYTIRIVDPGSPFCELDVRIRSAINILPGFTQVNDQYGGATNDDAHFQPLIGAQNIILAHEDTHGEGAVLEYAQIVLPRRGLYFTSEMKRRSRECGYEYYSTKSFECYMENFYVIYYGRDSRGAAFNRFFISHCINNRPTPPPPPPFCDLTTKKTDIVFMVDGSIMSDRTFGTFKLFMQYVASAFTIGVNGTQFGAFSFSSTTPGGNPFLLNAASDLSSLNLKFNTLQADGRMGQNITSAINYVSANYVDPANGYRTDRDVRHLVVYVTSSQMYSDGNLDPISAVTALKRSGSYGFAVVSLGFTSPPDWLVSLAGQRCSYFAGNDNDFATHAGNLIQSLSCFREPICGM
ncbi:unnamed protein product, partial [Mesorhabditis spiculigera]